MKPPPVGRSAIEANAVYPVSTFLRRLGIGRHSLTALRRQGLPVHSIGRRSFIDGGEALAFLRRLWQEGNSTAAGESREGQP